MTTLYPQPPNPWAPEVWLEMTRSTLWLVGPWGRCILEAGDDAWPDGKIGGTYCGEQAEELWASVLPFGPAGHTWSQIGHRESGGGAVAERPSAAQIFGLDHLPTGGHGPVLVEESFAPARDVVMPIALPPPAVLLICAMLAAYIIDRVVRSMAVPAEVSARA